MTNRTDEKKAGNPETMRVELTDEQLLIRYRREGDRGLFARLMRRYEHELFNYLRRYLGDCEMAEDTFQTTFLQVHLKCDTFEEGRRFRPWVYAIATNQAIDAQRRNRRHRMVSLDRTGNTAEGDEIGKLSDLLVSDVEDDPLHVVSQWENGQWVRDALNDLSEQMRSVVHLVYYEGMKYREAAEVLSIPVGTVKSRLHAAIAKLSDVWMSTHVQSEL